MTRQTHTKVYVEASVLTADHVSGVGHVLLNTLQHWYGDTGKRAVCEPVLLVPYDKLGKIKSFAFAGDDGFKVRTIPIPDKIFRALRKFNLLPPLDVLFGKGVYIFPNYWNWPVVRSKSITYVYDLGFVTHPEFVSPRNRHFLASHIATWLKRSDLVITDSKFVEGELETAYSAIIKQIAVVYNGVDIKEDIPTKEEVASAKERYGITGEYVLFVSNIEPRKNINSLIAAYQMMSQELKKVYSLVLVGSDGWMNEPILDAIANAQKAGAHVLKVKKFVPDADLALLYSGATLLVHPALYEGFGMTPLEAMCHGVPVAVADNSAIPEVVGDAGVYFNAQDVPSIANAMTSVLEDESLRRKLSVAGNKRARLFTWDKAVEQLIDCIERVTT